MSAKCRSLREASEMKKYSQFAHSFGKSIGKALRGALLLRVVIMWIVIIIWTKHLILCILFVTQMMQYHQYQIRIFYKLHLLRHHHPTQITFIKKLHLIPAVQCLHVSNVVHVKLTMFHIYLFVSFHKYFSYVIVCLVK